MRLEEIGDNNIILNINAEKHETILVFENFEIQFPNELYAQYSFSVNESLSKERVAKLLKDIEIYSIIEKIKKKFSKKLYSEHEVESVIKERGFAGDIANLVIENLKKEGIVDDEKYVQVALNALNNDYYGKYYIINYFKIKGVPDEIVYNIVFDEKYEFTKAEKYFESIHNLFVSKNFAKQKKKIYDEMVKRGFTIDIILKVLNGLKIDRSKENERLNKDYEKAYTKLSKGFTGHNLNTKIANYLINKGYEYDEILKLFAKEDK